MNTCCENTYNSKIICKDILQTVLTMRCVSEWKKESLELQEADVIAYILTPKIIGQRRLENTSGPKNSKASSLVMETSTKLWPKKYILLKLVFIYKNVELLFRKVNLGQHTLPMVSL